MSDVTAKLRDSKAPDMVPFEYRGKSDAKGEKMIETFWILGENDDEGLVPSNGSALSFGKREFIEFMLVDIGGGVLYCIYDYESNE